MIGGLARTHKADIDAAWEAVKDAERPRIHTFISTSDIHIEHQLQTDREDVKGQARAAVSHAKAYFEDVEFSPMDATRADVEFTAEVCEIAVDEGATAINIPDTVGYTTPRGVRGLPPPPLRAGAGAARGRAVGPLPRRPGPGGRQLLRRGAGRRAAGRVRDQRDRRARRQRSLEEIVMLINIREDDVGLRTGIVTREIARTSRLVSRLTGYAVQPNKAIVGRNAFAHESGIHQDGVLKERTTYEIMDATDVGLDANSIVLGKHSGRHALQQALEQLGFEVEGNALNAAFKRFKEVADRKKQVTALDLEAIVSDEMREQIARPPAGVVRGRGLLAAARRTRPWRAYARRRGGRRLVHRRRSGRRDLPGDQRRHRRRRAPTRVPVEAVTGGQDALGETSVMLEVEGVVGAGQGVATDILEAGARAYVRALSNAVRRRSLADEAEATTAAAAEQVTAP